MVELDKKQSWIMNNMVRVSILVMLIAVELTLSEDIVPVRTGDGPTPPPGGRRRKDPTADLPDLSRDELLAILDLIEKSGDSSGKSPVGTPTRAPSSVTTSPRYPTAAPTILPRVPSLYPDFPDVSSPEPAYKPEPVPTPAPTPRPIPSNYPQEPSPIDPNYPYRPTPPNYPAPTAPPPPNYPAPTAPPTPKPKKSFFDKLVRGFMKLISPEAALNSRSTLPNSGSMSTFLENFLQQLQHVNQNSQRQGSQQRSLTASTQQAVLDNLVKRLQGQNSEGSQFVLNLVQSLKNSNNPAASGEGPVNARAGGSTEQFLSALLKGIAAPASQTGQAGAGSSGGFLETFQRELLRSYNPSAGPTGQRSAGDVLLDGFKQILQKNS